MLTTDVTALKGCMTSPTDPTCTGTYSDATTLNKLVDSMNKCMKDPTNGDCASDYAASTTLPKVPHIIIFHTQTYGLWAYFVVLIFYSFNGEMAV